MLKNKRLWTKVLFSLAGAVGGFIYWKLVGCNSGSCPVNSLWYLSMVGGLSFGYLVGDLLGSIIFRRARENE